jgi:formylglycine-generating enzyme required for sulfatase activity
MNGATNSSSTETGAYTLNNAISGPAPAVNPGATVFLPTENQWYKAAYYKGGSTNAGYWTYATQSNLDPTAVQATTAGTGTSGGVSPVTSGNFANFNSGASWNGQTGNVTTVGTNGVPSAYGAFDLTGNVSEWTGTSPSNLDSKLVRGGGWGSPAGFSSDSSSRTNALAAFEGADLGFRLAAPVPEPSTWVMGAGGLACVAWRSIRRRRAR